MSEPGPEVMARFVGSENVDRGREYLEQLDPELHRYVMDFVYGEVYAGDLLDAKTRALCTVAMLATLGSSSSWASMSAPPAVRGLRRTRFARSCVRSRCTPVFRAPGTPWPR